MVNVGALFSGHSLFDGLNDLTYTTLKDIKGSGPTLFDIKGSKILSPDFGLPSIYTAFKFWQKKLPKHPNIQVISCKETPYNQTKPATLSAWNLLEIPTV